LNRWPTSRFCNFPQAHTVQATKCGRDAGSLLRMRLQVWVAYACRALGCHGPAGAGAGQRDVGERLGLWSSTAARETGAMVWIAQTADD
jgi:hypothetical protein